MGVARGGPFETIGPVNKWGGDITITERRNSVCYIQYRTSFYLLYSMTHPKRSHAKILLSSVFGPYAQDDAFGSRAINPMELYHNQVTRGQGSFSLRRFHRSWGILMIQE